MHAIVCEGVLQVDGPIVEILCGAHYGWCTATAEHSTVSSRRVYLAFGIGLDLKKGDSKALRRGMAFSS